MNKVELTHHSPVSEGYVAWRRPEDEEEEGRGFRVQAFW